MQEGGISCKKSIGLGRSQEYHILGKFVAASIENRDHSDYHDALDIYNNNNSNDKKNTSQPPSSSDTDTDTTTLRP